MDTRIHQNKSALTAGILDRIGEAWKTIGAVAAVLMVLITFFSWAFARPTREEVEKTIDLKQAPIQKEVQAANEKLDIVIDLLKRRN